MPSFDVISKVNYQEFDNALAINFGPNRSNCVEVKRLTKKLVSNLILKNKIIERKSGDNFYEKQYLYLNSNKALKNINWKTILTFEQTIKLTAEWYNIYLQKKLRKFYYFSNKRLFKKVL
jgi:nucleoside-diphosphate-sugar epimerase